MGIEADVALRPRPHAEPARRPLGPRRRPRRRGQAGRAVRAARHRRAHRRAPPPRELASVDDRSTPTCADGSRRGCCPGVTIGAVARLIARRLTAAGHAPDQLRRRRLELRDARVRPAQPHLRPRQGAPARRCGSGGRATARRSRRSTARPGRWSRRDGVIADGDDVAIGIAGVMGGGVDRDLRHRPPTCCSSWPGGTRRRSARTSKRLGLRSRGVDAVREGRRPRDRVPCRRAVRAARCRGRARPCTPARSSSRATCRPRRRCWCAPARVERILGTPISTATRCVGLLDPIGFTSTRRGRRPPGRRCRRGGPTRPPRST